MPLLLAYLGFVSISLPDGAHGVAWPGMRHDFGVAVSAVGFMLVSGVAGYVLSSVAAGVMTGRWGVGRLLAGSTALSACALAGYALAPGLPAVVAAAFVLGVGSGAIDSGLNAYAARHFGARQINWLHASFGAGAASGPLVMTAVLAAGLVWRWGYGALAVVQVALAVVFVATARAWAGSPTGGHRAARAAPGGPPSPAGTAGAGGTAAGCGGERTAGAGGTAAAGATGSRRTWALPALWLGAAGFAVEVSIEMSAALWAYLLLTESRGVATGPAGLAVSAYWGAMLVGRLLSGAVTDRLGVHRVLTSGVAGLILGAALVTVPGPGWLAAAGLALVGFAAAPMFPLLTLTTAERVGQRHADRTIGVQVGAAAVGAAATPALVGVLIGRSSPEALGPCLLMLALLLAVVYTRLRPRHTTN